MNHDTQDGNIKSNTVLTTVTVFVLAIVTLGLCFLVIQGREVMKREIVLQESSIPTDRSPDLAFPVGVNPEEKEIIENPAVEHYFDVHVRKEDRSSISYGKVMTRVLGKLAKMDWYQNLASLSSRLLVIQAGERKEEIADNFGEILNWNKREKRDFLEWVSSSTPHVTEGVLAPGNYTVSKEASPADVILLLEERFRTSVLDRYGTEVSSKVPLRETLIVASLLEREAYDFEDMRYISGIIWNRLFADMKLQLDATLQYAKGSKPTEPWWPKVLPKDKYIASVYNTYKHYGLPPEPISNPSLEAVLAALNPRKTDCMFYFHDSDAGFHCADTYEEHVTLLKEFYGRGR